MSISIFSSNSLFCAQQLLGEGLYIDAVECAARHHEKRNPSQPPHKGGDKFLQAVLQGFGLGKDLYVLRAERVAYLFCRDRREAFVLNDFRVEIDVRYIRLLHTIFVLRQEIRHQTGESVQLHARDEFLFRIAFAYGIDSGFKF